jgi:hypothetical protein
MKKFSLFIIAITLFSACKTSFIMNDQWLGHWVNKAFVDSIQLTKNPNLIQNTPFVELIFDRPDSNLRQFIIGKESRSLTYVPLDENTLEVKNYQNATNAFLVLQDNQILLQDLDQQTIASFIKITAQDFPNEDISSYISYGVCYINKILFSGNYQYDDAERVTFHSNGGITGLPDMSTYAPCLSGECLAMSKKANLYATNKQSEGKNYDWEIKNDSLFIYDLDYSRYPMQIDKYDRKNIKYALKKIN